MTPAQVACSKCGQKFTSAKALADHFGAKHKLTIGERQRKKAEQQNWACYYCGERMSENAESARAVTLDHIIPRAHGGTYAQRNLVAACRTCNGIRGHADFEAFRDLLRGRRVTKEQLWPEYFRERYLSWVLR
jgi:5-methylcytosine-specific restriction endonuclease McrA